MKLTLEQVRNVAALARLGLSDDELERMRDQLSSILTSIETIEELDTDAIPPTAQTIDLVDVVREDIPNESLPLEKVFQNAPRHQDGFFVVQTPFAAEETES
jgi:aspartyl-tRNA(Asn)/glutamyl-tRNA(Gln) amidotransferase subunit C